MRLVPFTRADADQLLGRAPGERRWADPTPTPGDLRVAQRIDAGVWPVVSDKQPFGPWIILDEDDVALGGVGFHSPPNADGEVEVGYGVAVAARGRGVATRALAALLALDLPGVRTIVAETDLDNVASHRVLTRNGFVEAPPVPDALRWTRPR
jgi:RimJ/RimL family protein N-acetyltransferase